MAIDDNIAFAISNGIPMNPMNPKTNMAKNIRNTLLINNSLVAESSMKMLTAINLDEIKSISEIDFSKKKEIF